MHGFWMEWLTLVAVFGIAVLSPGPDFVVAVRNALTHGRAAGFWTAWGFAAGVLVHVSYTLMGIAALIAQSIVVFDIIKYIGAAYLIYMGYKALRSQGAADMQIKRDTHAVKMNAWQSWRNGFITNLFNPKASLFFMALFTQIVKADTPLAIQIFYGLTCATLCGMWFTGVSYILTTARVRAKFLKASKWIDRACGAVFIGLGLKLALTKAPMA